MGKTTEKIKSIAAAALIPNIIAASALVFVLFPRRAAAQSAASKFASACVGGLVESILGNKVTSEIEKAADKFTDKMNPINTLTGSVPVDDVNTRAELKSQIKTSALENCLLAAKDIAMRVAREILKKQILDQIVDQTIRWIQDGTQPKFVEDFGQFVSDSANAGIGEAIREIGLGEFCDSPLKARILIGLQTPPRFYEGSSCTLDDVVGNIEAFKENFQNGGWIGIQEAASPQNNRHGAYLLAMEKVIEETEKQEKISEAKLAGGGGFLPQEVCTEWALINSLGGLVKENGREIGRASNPPRKVSDPPPIPADAPPEAVRWVCNTIAVTTPSKTIGDTISRVVNSDIDYILSSDELVDYAAALSTAVVNRLTKEAVVGLKNLTTKDSSEHETNIANAATSYGDSVVGVSIKSGVETGTIEDIRALSTELFTYIEQTSSTLNRITSANSGLLLALDNVGPNLRGLTQCLLANALFELRPAEFLPTETLDEAVSREGVWIPERRAKINGFIVSANDLKVKTNNPAYSVSELSSLLSQIQDDVGDLIVELNAELTTVNSFKSAAESNRDRCNSGL